jgi:exodeoxyribonuclease VII large subunit
LKDANAQVRCVFFRNKAALMGWAPENGMQVEVRALPTLYEARGEFQLTVEAMRRSGLGALFEAFERLKRKLEQEGLFDAMRRKQLPAFARSVGIVTSPDAVALHDVLITLSRRMPGMRVVLYPTPVQGAGAGERIARAIRAATVRAEVDVLILCRGGGSMEDLWAFNEESVARAIVACTVPVVSGVGHETDFTIADFVADARAPTPTAAAELVSPNRAELMSRLGVRGARRARDIDRALNTRMQQVDYLVKRLIHPGERIETELRQTVHLASRLHFAMGHGLEASAWHLSALAQRLRESVPDIDAQIAHREALTMRLRHAQARSIQSHEARLGKIRASLAHLNPMGVLERGYSIAAKLDGRIVRAAAEVLPGERLRLTFASGGAQVSVEQGDNPED